MLRKILILLCAGAVLAAAFGAWATGLVGYERHSGYFAPVWDAEGESAYVLKRETAGFVWGLGWEHFTPPATSRVTSDRFELLRLDPQTGDVELLHSWEESPLLTRNLDHYRGRIFNTIAAKLEPAGEGVEVLIRMDIPRVPQSEQWSLKTLWDPSGGEQGAWEQSYAGPASAPDAVLRGGRELLTLPGPEGFDSAVLLVEDDGSHRVLLRAPSFRARYGGGVPDALVAERSSRARIERSREFSQVQEELVARYRSQGLNEGEATLKAYDEMQALGYLPRDPTILATPVERAPEGARVFQIPELYIRSGLFQDIARAIEQPGKEVKTSTGDYLQYNEDRLGPRLREYREAGNDSFVVEVEGRLYLMETKRP
ncbi:hypothetical protein [Limibacillus halophilus]